MSGYEYCLFCDSSTIKIKYEWKLFVSNHPLTLTPIRIGKCVACNKAYIIRNYGIQEVI